MEWTPDFTTIQDFTELMVGADDGRMSVRGQGAVLGFARGLAGKE